MKFNAILLDIAEGIATITLNRPDKLNSFTGEMHADLKQAMQIIQADAQRARADDHRRRPRVLRRAGSVRAR